MSRGRLESVEEDVAPIIPSFDSHSVFSNYSPPFAEPNNQPNALSPATSQHSDAPSLPAGDSLERASRAADKGGLKNILTSAKGKAAKIGNKVLRRNRYGKDDIQTYRELCVANESSASSALHTNGGVSSGVSGGGGVDLSLPSQLRSSRSLVGEALTRASSQLIMGDLYVRVASAQGVRAADPNGLSDPYCHVSLGHIHKQATRVCPTTLNPNWNETFVFSAEQVHASVMRHCPFLLFQVYDYDGPLAVDDFLGQAELDLLRTPVRGDTTTMLTLDLSAKVGGVRHKGGLGCIQIAVWVQFRDPDMLPETSGEEIPSTGDIGNGGVGASLAKGSGLRKVSCGSNAAAAAHADATPNNMLCSLLWPPSLPKQLPLVMHGHECAMYEEPCLGFAVMMVHEVRGLQLPGFPVPLPFPGLGNKTLLKSHTTTTSRDDPESSSTTSTLGRSTATAAITSSAAALGSSTWSAARAVHSFLTLKPPPQQQPPSPTTLTSEGSLGARHRMRDGMHRAQQHMKLHKRGSTDVSGAHEDEEEEEEYDDEDEDEGGGGGGGKKHGGVGGERNGSEQQRKRDRLMRTLRDDSQSPLNVHRHHEHVDDQADLDDVANVIAREESRAAYMDTEEGALGDYDQLLYYRIKVTAKTCLKGRLAPCKDGHAQWNHPMVLAVPMPLLNMMKVNLRFYATPKRTKVGKLVAEVSFKPQDVLEQVAEGSTLRQQRKKGIPEGRYYPIHNAAGATVGEVRFAVAMVDTDIRRLMNKMPVLIDLSQGKHAAQIMQELEMSTYPMHGMDSAPPQLTTPPQPATSGTSMQSVTGPIPPATTTSPHTMLASSPASSTSSTSPHGPIAPNTTHTTTNNNTHNTTINTGMYASTGNGNSSSASSVTGGPGVGGVGGGGLTAASSAPPKLFGRLMTGARDGLVAVAPWNVAKKVVNTISNNPNALTESPSTHKTSLANTVMQLKRIKAVEQVLADQIKALGYVTITLENLVLLPTAPKLAVNSALTAVMKCGPHWGVSTPKHQQQDGVHPWGWCFRLPVYDPNTVLTLALFAGTLQRKQRKQAAQSMVLVGKLRVRLSTLTNGVLQQCCLGLLGDRLAKNERVQEVAHATMRFKLVYTSPPDLYKRYLKPLLAERLYYLGVADGVAGQELRMRELVFDWLGACEPPIPREVALQVLGVERQRFIMSRLRLNIHRIKTVAGIFQQLKSWMPYVQSWENPVHSSLVIAGISSAAFYPNVVIPMAMLYIVVYVLCMRDAVPGGPRPMEEDPPAAVDYEEPPDKQGGPYAQLKLRYLNLVRIIVRLQVVLDDVASALERLTMLFTWADPLATVMVLFAMAGVAMAIGVLGLPVCVSFAVFWVLRPPALRTPTPPAPACLLARLPTNADVVA